MKLVSLILITLVVMPVVILAQNETPKNLELIDHPYFMDKTKDTCILLQKETSHIKNILVKTYHIIEGESSSLVIDLSDDFSFLVLVSEDSFITTLQFLKLDIKNGNRQVQFSSVAMAMGNKTNENNLPTSIRKLDNKYYEITLDENIEKGQYAFISGSFDAFSTGTNKVFTFSIQ